MLFFSSLNVVIAGERLLGPGSLHFKKVDEVVIECSDMIKVVFPLSPFPKCIPCSFTILSKYMYYVLYSDWYIVKIHISEFMKI